MQPTKLDHIIAMVALYRPGPMEFIPSYIDRLHGKETITYRHPMLEPIMGETYGFAIYQEQVMQAAMQLAGYTASEADTLRKVISKKKVQELEKHHKKFVEGAVERGIDRETADAIFTDWEGFAHYGFNKSHAADYGVVAVQTAFLKTHYPLEYMTALLSQSKNESEKVALYVADSRAMGIDVLPPDVNYSGWDFEIEDLPDGKSVIRFGLGAVKNVGQNSVDVITVARQAGQFKDINDFARRVDLRKVGRRALESMIRVGALDSFGDRRALLEGMDTIMSISESHYRAQDAGQMTIFGFVEGLEEEIHLPRVAHLDQREKLEWEHELLGIYLSDHPLTPYMPILRKRASHLIVQLKEAPHQSTVSVGGTVGQLRTILTKKGSEMAFGTLDDIQGSVELVIFPRVWSKYAQLLRSNEVLLVKGKVDNEKSDPKILVDKVEAIQLTEETIAAAGEDAPLDDAPPPFEEDFPFNEANIAEDNSLGGENYISFSTGTPKKADPAPVAYVQEVNVASEVMVADHINLDLRAVRLRRKCLRRANR
jgi:DNA polymerase-3 subunit alpha